MGKVRILPERILPDLLEGARLGSHRRTCTCPTEDVTPPTGTPPPDSIGGRQRMVAEFFGVPLKKNQVCDTDF